MDKRVRDLIEEATFYSDAIQRRYRRFRAFRGMRINPRKVARCYNRTRMLMQRIRDIHAALSRMRVKSAQQGARIVMQLLEKSESTVTKYHNDIRSQRKRPTRI